MRSCEQYLCLRISDEKLSISKCFRKVTPSSRSLALVFLLTEEFNVREHHTAEAKGTANAECIEVGMLPLGEGVTNCQRSAERNNRKGDET
jgi:hypothetical protein